MEDLASDPAEVLDVHPAGRTWFDPLRLRLAGTSRCEGLWWVMQWAERRVIMWGQTVPQRWQVGVRSGQNSTCVRCARVNIPFASTKSETRIRDLRQIWSVTDDLLTRLNTLSEARPVARGEAATSRREEPEDPAMRL